MDDQDLHELQDPANWIDEQDSVRPAAKSPRAVVSVAFSREDFEVIERYARELGMRTSEFIRRAALDRITPGHVPQTKGLTGGTVRTDPAPVTSNGSNAKVTSSPPRVHSTA